MRREELERYLADFLEIARFRDYCPNGLQVEGKAEVRRLVTGVTASQTLLDRAAALGADAVLVHHGYFWRGEDPRVVGIKRGRLGTLLRHDINLLAYHLPLDAHPEVGNNAQLARRIGLQPEGRFGEDEMAWSGRVEPGPLALAELAARVESSLGRVPLVIGDPARRIERLGWCTGAAQDYLDQAAALGLDAFISGEISERTFHSSRETGCAYLSAGHHATERFGVQALGSHLAERFGLHHEFVEVANPV